MKQWKKLQNSSKKFLQDDKNLIIIKNVLKNILSSDFNFFIFWSRARWDFRNNSDYDIWIKWKNFKKISFDDLLKIKSEFENKPFLIDIVDLNNCWDEFLKIIDSEKIEI